MWPINYFMEPEVSLPCSQNPAIGSCLESVKSNSHPQGLLLFNMYM